MKAAIAGLEFENARLFEAASVSQAVDKMAPASSLAPPVLEIVRKAAFWLSLDDLWDYLLPLKSTAEVA